MSAHARASSPYTSTTSGSTCCAISARGVSRGDHARRGRSPRGASARRSASSMKCVVSRIVLPCDEELAQAVPDEMPRLRVEAGGRLVEDQELGIVDERAREREPPLHAAGERADRRVALARQAREFEQARNARLERRAVEAEIAAVDDAGSRVTVKSGSRLSICGTTPTRMRASRAAFGTGSPTISISPPSGSMRPRQQRSVVVLPAPLGPSRPKHSPRRIVERQSAHDLVRAVALAQPLHAQDAVVARQLIAPRHSAMTTCWSCGSRPWKKWPRAREHDDRQLLRARPCEHVGSGTTSSSSPWITMVSAGTVSTAKRPTAGPDQHHASALRCASRRASARTSRTRTRRAPARQRRLETRLRERERGERVVRLAVAVVEACPRDCPTPRKLKRTAT